MRAHEDYDVMLEEIHHTQKEAMRQAVPPSHPAEQVMKSIPSKKQWVNHISDNTEDLEIISERIDPAPGTHKIKYSSAIDDIEIIHTAHSRKGFAGRGGTGG